jgi:hypothetical protein
MARKRANRVLVEEVDAPPGHSACATAAAKRPKHERASNAASDTTWPTSPTGLVDWVYREVDSYAVARVGKRELEEQMQTKFAGLAYGEVSVPRCVLHRAFTP